MKLLLSRPSPRQGHLDLLTNQTSLWIRPVRSPVQQETTQVPGRGGRFGQFVFWLLTSVSGWAGLVGTKGGVMRAAGAGSWGVWRGVGVRKIGGDWDSFLFDQEKLRDKPKGASWIAGVPCSKTRCSWIWTLLWGPRTFHNTERHNFYGFLQV